MTYTPLRGATAALVLLAAPMAHGYTLKIDFDAVSQAGIVESRTPNRMDLEESESNVGTAGFFDRIRDIKEHQAAAKAAATAAATKSSGEGSDIATAVEDELDGDLASVDAAEGEGAPAFDVQTSVQVQGGFVTEVTPETTIEPVLVTNREMQEITDKYANELSSVANLPPDTSYVAMVEINSNGEGEGASGALASLTQTTAVSAVPIPSALPLALLGFATLAFARRRS